MNLKNLRFTLPGPAHPTAVLRKALFLPLALLVGFSAQAQWIRKADALRKRSEVTSVVYDNKLYTFAGFGNEALETEPSSEVYDPATDTWTLLAPMPDGKTVTHQGVVLIDNTVWHIAGRVGTHPGPLTSETWIYNISTNSWSPGPQLLDPATGTPLLWGGGGAALVGRTLHIFGGFIKNACSNDQDVYHLTLDVDAWRSSGVARWENKRQPMPQKRCHVLTTVLAGKIYAMGGQFGHDCGEVDQPIAHVYDPVSDAWQQLPNLPAPRSHAEGGVFPLDGKIYIVGGQQALSRNTNKVTVFDPAGNNGQGAWSEDPALALPYGYEGLSAKVIGNTFIYSHGGIGSSQNVQNRTYARTITRNPVRTLGFSAACLTLSATTGEGATGKNLLFTIDGATPYQLASDAAWLSVTGNRTGNALPTGVPVAVQVNAAGLAPGNYTGTVTATGTGGVAYAPASFCVNLTVTAPPNTAPVLTAIGSRQATAGQPLAFTATAADAEQNALSYSLAGAPAGAAIHPATGVFTWTPLQAGTYSFAVRVTDNGVPALSDEETVEVTVAPAPVSPVTRLNAGGPAYETPAGKTYGADAYFSGGKLTTYAAGEVAGTDADELYRSGRFGEAFSYDIPTGNGAFTVTLHFNETYWGSLAAGGIGSRKFNVDVEGKRRLTEYDIFARAGGALTAVSETMPVYVKDGVLTIQFARGSADFPRVSAIEVEPAAAVPNRYEAEEAFIAGGEVSDLHAGHTGAGFVDYINPTGDHVEWTLPQANAENAVLHFRYAHGGLLNRSLQLEVNGVVTNEQVTFTPTGAWDQWSVVSVPVTLAAGPNKVKLTANGTSGPNLDYLEIGSGAALRRFEAEANSFNGLEVTLSPNPASDRTRVTFRGMTGEALRVQVLNPLGKTVRQFTFPADHAATCDLALQGLPRGVYLVQVQGQSIKRITRLVIQ